MNKIIIIFIVITGLYLLITKVPVLFQNGQQVAEVTSEVEQIEIDTSSLTTTIIASANNELKTEYHGRGTVSVKERNGKIHIEAKGPRFNLLSFNKSRELKIFIPESYQKDLRIAVGSGTVTFLGENSQTPFQLNPLKRACPPAV